MDGVNTPVGSGVNTPVGSNPEKRLQEQRLHLMVNIGPFLQKLLGFFIHAFS
jgi:hypothetical protein